MLESKLVNDSGLETLKKQISELVDNYTGKTVKDQILTQEKYNTYLMGSPDPIATTPGLCSTFSGADIVGVFDGDICELMSIKIKKDSLEAIFALGKSVISITEKLGEGFPFHLIGINESEDKGLVSGLCVPTDWETVMSIDELNIEMKVSFKAWNIRFRGWMGGTASENIEIGKVFYKLRWESFILNGGDPQNVLYKQYLEWEKENV